MNIKYSVILKDTLKPAGGPSGYLYNLKKSLESNNIDSIQLLTYGLGQDKVRSSRKKAFKRYIKKLKTKLIPVLIREKYFRQKEKQEYFSFYSEIESNLKNTRLKHFHHTKDFYYYKSLYNNSKDITLLMSHAPEPPHIELEHVYQADGYSKKRAVFLAKHQKEMDIYSFKNADYIIFPCQEAVAPYQKFFDEFDIDIKKLRFIITTSDPLKYNLPVEIFKKNHHISTKKTILAYVGRKTKIKGYDIFCDAAKLLVDDTRFYFIAAGAGPIPSPALKNFLDIGWTDDPGSLINSADFLIVPNRDTYFDLGIIQALSLNTSLLMTHTGGNRWFADKHLNVDFFDTKAQTLAEIIQNTKVCTSENNVRFFNKNLNNKYFAPNYLKLYEGLTD